MATSLQKAIRQWLESAQTVAVLGVGSDLRGDDVAGILVAEALVKKSRRIKFQKTFQAFVGATAPENLTGELKRFHPSHLIIVDSAEVGLKKGEIQLVNPKEVVGCSSSTHNLPMKVFVDYLTHSIGCETIIIGIQPARLDFGVAPSPEIKKAVKYIADTIAGVLSGK